MRLAGLVFISWLWQRRPPGLRKTRHEEGSIVTRFEDWPLLPSRWNAQKDFESDSRPSRITFGYDAFTRIIPPCSFSQENAFRIRHPCGFTPAADAVACGRTKLHTSRTPSGLHCDVQGASIGGFQSFRLHAQSHA